MEIVGGRVFQGTPVCSQCFLNNAVDGVASVNRSSEPLIIEPKGLRADPVIGSDLQEFRPVHHPLVVELWAIDQALDPTGSFVF